MGLTSSGKKVRESFLEEKTWGGPDDIRVGLGYDNIREKKCSSGELSFLGEYNFRGK